MTTPAWLQRHLESIGLWDLDGVGRAARARRCRGCRNYVLAGLDADRCALPVAADPEPLSARGEAIALVMGRTTFALRFLSGRLELDHRGHFEIRGAAGSLRYDVLAGHECGTLPLGNIEGLGADSRLAPVAVPHSAAEPPY